LLGFSCINCGLQYGPEGSWRVMGRLGPLVLVIGGMRIYWNQKR
jgi:hypothetical protein